LDHRHGGDFGSGQGARRERCRSIVTDKQRRPGSKAPRRASGRPQGDDGGSTWSETALEQAVEVAHPFGNRDDLDLITIGIMLVEDQIAPMNERAGVWSDIVAWRADTGEIPYPFDLGVQRQQQPVRSMIVIPRDIGPDPFEILAGATRQDDRGQLSARRRLRSGLPR